MREIITTTGASLFTAGVIIAQAIAGPVAPGSAAPAQPSVHVVAQR